MTKLAYLKRSRHSIPHSSTSLTLRIPAAIRLSGWAGEGEDGIGEINADSAFHVRTHASDECR